MAPFKDYNNKMILSIQGISSGKTLKFTANFMQNTGWGTCFGYGVYNMKFSTVQVGTKYVTTIT
jgi:chitinase